MMGDVAMQVLHAVVAAQLATTPVPPADLRSVGCLAQNLWFEARGSSVTDQIAVANVVLNRVEDRRYPNDVCAVVWQPYQFSWTHDGRSDQVRVRTPRERRVWERIVDISVAALTGHVEDPTNGATHYHANYVRPAWASRLKRLVQIERHIYYRYRVGSQVMASN